SLAAVEVVARLRETLGTDIPLRVLFEHPTIERMAAWIDAHSATSNAALPIRRLTSGERAPLSFAQGRAWLLQKLQSDSATSHVTPILRLRGPLDRAHLTTAIVQLLERHEALRSIFVEGDAGPEQRVEDVPADVLEYHSIRDVPVASRETQRQQVIRTRNARPFELGGRK